MDSNFLKLISIVADLLTLVTFIAAIPFALLRKNKSILAFQIGNFLHYILRSAVILFAFLIIFKLSEALYFVLILPFKGQVDSSNYVWETGKEWQHLAAYFISGAVGLPIFWIISSAVWTSSWNTAKEFLNLFLPNNKILIKQESPLEILNATYRTSNAEVEVTQIVRQRVSNNKLTITASNDLAGDPHPGVAKKLIINYRIGRKNHSVEVNEGDSITIPELNFS